MFKLQVIDPDTDHFLIWADEPVRIEISRIPMTDGFDDTIIAHVYKGLAIDLEQGPLLVYDGNEDTSNIVVP